MTTLFLDHDGVLCTERQYKMTDQSPYWVHGTYFSGRGVYPFDEKCVKALNEILGEVECEIIVDSDWRVYNTLEQLQEFYKENGVIQVPVGVTEQAPTSMSWMEKNRAGEISKYIKEHEITKYFAVDDLDLYKWLGKEHFIITDDWTGIKKPKKKLEIIKRMKAL